MKTAIVITIALFCHVVAQGQLHDAQWAIGDHESIIDFRNVDSVKIDSLSTFEYFTLTNASICDSAGNLLYYTNGISISGVTDTLANGNNLSPCSYSDQYAIDGLNIPQAAIFIPQPGNSRYYYLFHFSNDYTDTLRPKTLYYSLIDKEGNAGQGLVIEKNVPILQGTILREGGMTACKHANGRDYWLIMGKYNTNTFYEFLVTPDGIEGPTTQTIGPVFPRPYDIAYSKFSQDGSKYATGIYGGAPILVMDFDRCTGVFSNPDTIFNNLYYDTISHLSGSTSVEFSPNNRFLYTSFQALLTQYDLTSVSHDTSIIYRAGNSEFYGIHMLQIAPNGKLYASTWNGGLRALHVINYPDLKGDSADFMYGGQPTFTINSINLPNTINYRLGSLIGSGCDTITGLIEPTANSQQPRILPNPADKYAYVEMGMQGNYEFELLNVAGQVLAVKETKQVDIFDTEDIAAGVYFIRVIDMATGNEIAAKEIAVVH